jgi:basic membrane lipoprotein Med (substrate-binding protein (PBP1-ABC) superfamily)
MSPQTWNARGGPSVWVGVVINSSKNPWTNRFIRITLIRMTFRHILIAGLLALTVSGCVQAAAAAPQRQVVVVVDAAAANDPAVLAEAQAAVERAGDGAQLRVPRTPTEQLSVTHYFAAKRYDLVVGVGLDRRVAVTPVAARFPDTRFVAARPANVAAAIDGGR